MKAGTRDIFILSALVASFLFMGAAIFQVLESPSQEHHEFDDRIDKVILEKLRTNLSVNMSKAEFDKLVRKIQEYHEKRYTRTSSSYKWTYSGSLYFTASVITTIGTY